MIPEQEFFSDGITEDIITDLAKVSGLFVLGRNTVFTYKGKPVHLQRIAQGAWRLLFAGRQCSEGWEQDQHQCAIDRGSDRRTFVGRAL